MPGLCFWCLEQSQIHRSSADLPQQLKFKGNEVVALIKEAR